MYYPYSLILFKPFYSSESDSDEPKPSDRRKDQCITDDHEIGGSGGSIA